MPLIDAFKNGSGEIHDEVSNDNICVSFDDYKTTVSKDSKPNKNNNEINKFILEYLSIDKKWVNENIGKIQEVDANLHIPIFINNSKINFKFTEPQDNKSDIWEFTNIFNYDDPWNLQNEPAKIAFKGSTVSSYKHNFWTIKPLKRKNNKKQQPI